MKESILGKIQEALQSLQKEGSLAGFSLPEVMVERPKDEAFGECTSNIALVSAKAAQKSPMEIAELLRAKLTDPAFEKVEVAAPGYLNFFLAPPYFADVLEKSLAGVVIEAETREKVMVEYSQPNTHKEFHIGHLRNVFIGSTLVNVLRRVGHETLGVNYIGDTGSHIAKCLWGIVTLHANEDLDAVANKPEFLGKAYAEAVQAIEGSEENEAAFKALQNRFEAGDPELVALWEKTRQWSLDEFDRLYGELGVTFDEVFYESVEEQVGKALLPELLEKGVIKESEGAIVADLEDVNLGILVLVRRDGSALYGLKDIPLAKKKFEQYGIDRSIYVVDIRQSLYFKQLFEILRRFGFHKRMQHAAYEFVSLKGGESMSSRKGNIIAAQELIDTVTANVKAAFPENPDPLAIALGAIRFAMLRQGSTSKIEFDIEESVRLDGATGPYVQYAHARIASILRKAEESALAWDGPVEPWDFHDKEKELIREISRFPELLIEVSETNEVHKIAHFALTLAEKFHSFYAQCQVIDAADADLSQKRLQLSAAVQKTLKETLDLLGIAAPEKM
ncbi:MAG: arginine--tRNA ligase [Candidatus Moraniibacteriota bacterium]